MKGLLLGEHVTLTRVCNPTLTPNQIVFGDDAMGFGAHYVTHPLTRAGFERLAGR